MIKANATHQLQYESPLCWFYKLNDTLHYKKYIICVYWTTPKMDRKLGLKIGYKIYNLKREWFNTLCGAVELQLTFLVKKILGEYPHLQL